MVSKQIPKFFRSRNIPVQEGKDVTGSVFQKQATSGPSQTAALEACRHPGESDERTRSWNSMWTEAYRVAEDLAGSTVSLAKMDDLFDLFFAQRVVFMGGCEAKHLERARTYSSVYVTAGTWSGQTECRRARRPCA